MSLSSKYKGISHSDTKLVIDAFSNLFSGIKAIIVICIILEIFFGVNLPFFLALSVIDEFNMMPTALNYSKLNCSRINDLVTCSLVGTSLFGALEKVMDSKHGNLTKATKRSVKVLWNKDRSVFRNDILVLVTKNEEIYIYISPDLLDKQISDLNIFLLNKKQSKIYIQTNKSTFLNLLLFDFLSSSSFSFLRFSFTFLIYCFVIFMLICTISLESTKAIYVFNKENDKFQTLKISNRKVLLEIPLNEIKQVYLVENIYVHETKQICLIDNVYEEIITTMRSNLEVSYTIKLCSATNTEFISININEILSRIITLDYGMFFISYNKYYQIRDIEAHKFADLIRCFLQLNFYQSIVETTRIVEE